jgi:dipeptidase E
LFLGSDGLGALHGFLGGETVGRRVAFVPTAAEPVADKSFLRRDLEVLRGLGLVTEEVDIGRVARPVLEARLQRADLIFVEGGTAAYLLKVAIDSGFAELLPRLIGEGKPYVGMSGGALLVGPDIAPFFSESDRELGLATTKALGIVDFVVLPHADSRAERYAEIAAEFADRFTLVPITDGEAVVVEGDSYSVVRS